MTTHEDKATIDVKPPVSVEDIMQIAAQHIVDKTNSGDWLEHIKAELPDLLPIGSVVKMTYTVSIKVGKRGGVMNRPENKCQRAILALHHWLDGRAV